jgi:hypothetical protein
MNSIFEIVNLLALLGWLTLVLFPNRLFAINTVKYGLISLLAFTYLFLMIPLLPELNVASFSTLENVKELFKNDQMVNAGWIHYLVFDLFVGVYIVENSLKTGMKRWKYTLCLPFTFLIGPLGLIIFYFFKISKR